MQDTQYRIQDTGYRTIVKKINQHYSVASTPSYAGCRFWGESYRKIKQKFNCSRNPNLSQQIIGGVNVD